MLILFLFGVVATGLVLAATNPRAAVLVVIFFVSWSGLEIDVGLRITVYQLLLLPLLLVTVARSTFPGWQPPALPAPTLFVLLVLQASIWSLLQVGMIPTAAVGDSALRGPTARAIIQMLLFLFTISPAVIIACWLKDSDDVLKAFRIYMASLVVLALLGWFQIIVKYSTGVDPSPIGALNVALGGSASIGEREGQFAFEALKIYRMNSFAGEPRSLAVALAVGMLALQILALVVPGRPRFRFVMLYIFLFLTQLATFSTSGIGVWIVGTIATLPLLWVTRTPIARRTSSLLVAATSVCFLLVAIVAGLEANDVPILDLLGERTTERITRDGAIEDFDLAIIDYFRAEPAAMILGAGLGNAHLYAMPFLDPLFALYAEGRIFVGKSGLIRTISETGIVGLALLLAWFGRLILLAAAVRTPNAPGAAVIAAVPMIAFLMPIQFQNEMFTAAGLLSVLIIGARSTAKQPATGWAA